MTVHMFSPDWVVLGFQTQDQFFVAASETLTVAEIERQVDFLTDNWESVFNPVASHYELSAVMTSLVVASGASYAEAFANLMHEWDPDQRPDVGGLDAPRRALGKAAE